jgi:hypothetical protein
MSNRVSALRPVGVFGNLFAYGLAASLTVAPVTLIR